MDDNIIISAINNSPLSDEDKAHWQEMLPKLDNDQRNRLHHSLTAKTEITKAIKAVENALQIIEDAEKEAEDTVSETKDPDPEAIEEAIHPPEPKITEEAWDGLLNI